MYYSRYVWGNLYDTLDEDRGEMGVCWGNRFTSVPMYLHLGEKMEEELMEVEVPRRAYLFCMKKIAPNSKTDRNQWIAVAICKKANCKFLEEPEGEKPKCHCPTSLQYLSAVEKLSKGELDHIKKERRAGRRLEREEPDEQDSGQVEDD